MKINLGSGNNQLLGYINIDINPLSNPDYVLNLEIDTLPFEDNSIDEIVAYHIFEHLGQGFFHCMQEIYRVCKHKSLINVKVPHPRHDSFLIDPTHKRPILTSTLEMFSKVRNNIMKAETPLGQIYDVDFEITNCALKFDPFWETRIHKMSEKKIAYVVNTYYNVVQEIFIKMVAIKPQNQNTQINKTNLVYL